MTNKEKIELQISKTLEYSRNKPIDSTLTERWFLLDEATRECEGLPQPLIFGKGMTYILERASTPIEDYDILVGRFIEKVPSAEEDEEIQAEWLRYQYSIWFSHPSVEGIMYWDLVDGNAPAGALGAMNQGWNTHYAGLLRFDMSEKPAFKMMKHLFNEEWHTEESLQTDENGYIGFRGFFGTYRLEIEINGRREERFVDFTKHTDGEITVTL